MRNLSALAMLAVFSNCVLAGPDSSASKPVNPVQIEVPKENLQAGTTPDAGSAEALAKSILQAVQSLDLNSYTELYFPEKEFLELKDVPAPKSYFDGLIKEYLQDLKKLNTLVQPLKDVKFKSFSRGYCKWKEIGSEYNKIAYWSCYKNKIIVSSTAGQYSLPIRTLINWGERWYVTHLGHTIERTEKKPPK